MKNKILLGLLVLCAAGCATSTMYANYTTARFLPKDKFYTENVYPVSQGPGLATPYFVIGRVAIEGFASYGVSPETLTVEAQSYARKRGADAIINATTQIYRYWGGDALIRFKGDLIVYAKK